MINDLNALEQKIVSRIAPRADRHFWLAVAVAITRLGNFWLYPLIGAVLFAAKGMPSLWAIGIGSANIFFLHRVYPLLKEKCARTRPSLQHAANENGFKPIDVYSFPSGHVMTLTGVVVPVMVAYPETVWYGATAVLVMAWARIACSHHYPTDVIGGATIGFALTYPFAAYLLAH